ncbi:MULTISPECIES: coenzyme F420-0:L-glutamate ligase [unclassified Sphingomonas]|uniref:coenzyme F420-0:L-glutamate ligase n=1 Tax=unclassified Sphingomonas TaxID=196159 RepID=UPI000929E31D|nr:MULTISPECIES: coenzyme F420-0:L-glutamate ligase [unclassified Sphingomonas]MBN8849503.1 coenzyme F420-0:L-glutamate ligase [Sphingomonas sp.]OJV34408.1 MAG: coenzyme F420-0:L-glutamate ligase [Sphingomonas sp. 67-36]
MSGRGYSVTALAGVPVVRPGDDLCRVVVQAAEASGMALEDGDVVVLAQKIVSKAEGRQVALDSVVPSPAALELAARTGKDARLVELILSESDAVVRVRPNLLIVRHRLGLVLANAGIDQSNVLPGDGPQALLLPIDPDASAARLRDALKHATGRTVAVLVIDSLGRAWRMGTTGTAIGVAGLPAVLDLRGRPDLTGRKLESSELGLADEAAAAASLAMGQADEGTPVVILRGLSYAPDGSTARAIVRPRGMDLFQ